MFRWKKNNLAVGMVALGVAIAHNHMSRFKEQSILTGRTWFANHLPKMREEISVQIVCVSGGWGNLKSFLLFLAK